MRMRPKEATSSWTGQWTGMGDQLIEATDWHVSHSELVTVQSRWVLQHHLTLPCTMNNHNGTAYAVPSSLTSPEHRRNPPLLRSRTGLSSVCCPAASRSSPGSDRRLPSRSQRPGLEQAPPLPTRLLLRGPPARPPGASPMFRSRASNFTHQLVRAAPSAPILMHFPIWRRTLPIPTAFVKDSPSGTTRSVTSVGTHDVELSRNVEAISRWGMVGHSEDGSEINNLLCNNLGVTGRAAFCSHFRPRKPLHP
jgi:hypothetical protein